MVPRITLILVIAGVASTAWLSTWGIWRYDQAIRDIGIIETRRFEAPTLVTLGSGGAYENPSRLGPAIAFGYETQVVLVDAGRGVAETLRSAAIALAQPGSVYLTSLLPENTVGLDDLLIAGWRAGRDRPLRVVGPPGTQALVEALESSQREGIRALTQTLGLAAEGARFEAVEVDQGWSGSQGSITAEALALQGGPLAALAYRFEAGGRSVVMGSVGFDTEKLLELSRGAHALIHGAVFLEPAQAAIDAGGDDAARVKGEISLQLSLAEVAKVAARSGVRTLVLVRLRPPPLFDFQFERIVEERFSGAIYIGADGDEITL